MRSTRCLFAFLALALALRAPSAAASPPSASATVQGHGNTGLAYTDDGRLQVVVELAGPPAARAYGEKLADRSLSKAQAKAAAVAAGRAQAAANRQAQEAVGAALRRLGAREQFRVTKALNAIVVAVEPSRVRELAKIAGVRDVRPLELEYPTTSTSVPFLGVPDIWGNTIGLPAGATGTGLSIGIIDSGIDYQHADFGGTGLLADYQANDRTVTTDTIGGNPIFPTTKVVGGVDFAGDAYTGANAPVPDPDPGDCLGHGSHVAGIAAGLGVTAAGATYGGPYDNSAPFGSLRIGPGVAPGALLYAVRVFGCTGSTGLTVAGIEWTLDPNDDDDLSDHLDIINMSLGSNYGRLADSSATAAENAAATGMIVVCSAGNAGDTFYITGSPGVSSRTIATAASVDSGIAGAVLTVNSPPAIAGGYAASAANSFAPTPAPAPSGQTAGIVLAQDPADGAGPLTTDGCSALTNAAAIAGNIALVDRGTCGFQVKANNAQAAGAIGVIIANNVVGDPNFIAMGATGTTAVTIPTIMISLADRNTIVANLPANGTLAAATAADTIASFSSRGPRQVAPYRLKPDIAAPGLNITSVQTGFCNNTCLKDPTTTNGTYIPDNVSLTISGTSMASPHMAGVMALLRQVHPDWSVEQLKALAMNYALHDVTIGANGSGLKYAPSRIGAGRVDPAQSALGSVTALNADDTGVVSVAFNTSKVVGTATEVKTVRISNAGTAAQSYDLALSLTVDAPGIAFSLPGGSSVTVQPGSTADVVIQMDATASQMKHARDATVPPGQAAPAPLNALGTLARHWLTEESGYLVLSQSGTPKLRVPVYTTARPTSTMSAPATITTGGAGTGSTTIALTGGDVCTGTLGAGPTCTGTFPTDEVSLVTPFELQVVSPEDFNLAPTEADIRYAGVAFSSASNVLMFGVSTWGNWSTPAAVAFNVYIDNNEDGTWDRILFNSDPGSMSGRLFGTTATGQDSFLTGVFNIATSGVSTQQFLNRVSSAGADTAVFDNNVIFLAATPASLGLTAGDTTFRWKIVSCPGFAPLCAALNGFQYDEAAGPFFFNYAAQGLDFGGSNLLFDLNGASIPVTWNTANMATNGSLGALLLHHHNANGQGAETVTLDTAQQADLAISKSASNPTPALGSQVTFTLTATNNGPDAATGVNATDVLPTGLTYVSDDGGGAYDASSGAWTIGALAASASATLHIVATVDSSDQICNQVSIGASSPLDTVPGNDNAEVCVSAPRSADLELSMTSDVPSAMSGSPITYTLTLKNNGADQAYGLVTTLTLTPDVAVTGSTASAGTFNTSTKIWNVATLAAGATATLTVTVDAPNSDQLDASATVTATTADPNTADNTDSVTIPIGLGYFTLSPCRVYDSRTTTVFGASEVRTLQATGLCGVPAGARAISYNVTVVTPTTQGFLKIWEAGATQPLISSINFSAGQTRANNGVSLLSAAGEVSVLNGSAGTVDVIVDVSGYFN